MRRSLFVILPVLAAAIALPALNLFSSKPVAPVAEVAPVGPKIVITKGDGAIAPTLTISMVDKEVVIYSADKIETRSVSPNAHVAMTIDGICTSDNPAVLDCAKYSRDQVATMFENVALGLIHRFPEVDTYMAEELERLELAELGMPTPQ